MLFAQATTLSLAIVLMITCALFVKMTNGATFAVVPFVNPRALGAVADIVGPGGNAGAVAAGFLFKTQALDWHTAFFVLGAAVTGISFLSFAVNFSAETEHAHSPSAVQDADRPVVELVGASS